MELLQDWHGNAITEAALVQGFVTARILELATGATTDCSMWTLVATNSSWQCTAPGTELTAAGVYALTLESSAPEASGWSGAQYQQQLVVAARPEVDAAATAAAMTVSPWMRRLTAGVPPCISLMQIAHANHLLFSPRVVSLVKLPDLTS
jgi:hypothetical protein